MNTRLISKTLSLSFLFSAAAFAQTTSITELPSYSWKKFNEYVDTDLFYTHDFISNRGGAKSGPRNIGALDIFFESDFSKFSEVQGEMMVHYVHINGPDSRGGIGDAQGVSNVDMPTQVDRIGDLWYQHNWSDKFKTLVGIHDMSMEFNVTESSLSFLNGSFGTSAELATAGFSMYPVTAVGTRALYNFTDELSLKTALYDANPGDETTYRSFHSDIGNNEGYLHISELAYQTEGQKMAVAGWNNTRTQETLGEDGRGQSFGAYGLYEKKFGHSLWAFARYGWSNPLVNPIQSNFVAGAAYKGIFQKKKTNDEVGIGLARAHFSRQFLKNEEAVDAGAETAYEIFYQFKPIEQISLRPDFQYIKNPAGLNAKRDAVAAGLRTVVEL